MKPHYFEQDKADADDMMLGMAKMQGYVPQRCLLGGMVVMAEIQAGKDPCAGCEGPRAKCHGRPKSEMTPNARNQRAEARRADDPLD